jgi:hypothetical protein
LCFMTKPKFKHGDVVTYVAPNSFLQHRHFMVNSIDYVGSTNGNNWYTLILVTTAVPEWALEFKEVAESPLYKALN